MSVSEVQYFGVGRKRCLWTELNTVSVPDGHHAKANGHLMSHFPEHCQSCVVSVTLQKVGDLIEHWGAAYSDHKDFSLNIPTVARSVSRSCVC